GFKRRYIFPYMKFKMIYKADATSIRAPRINQQAAIFYNALKSLMEEFDNSENKEAIIENYSAPFHFEIKNLTSFRLTKVLVADKLPPTNEQLLRACLLLASMLDFLLNSPASPYYALAPDEIKVFRNDPVHKETPLYTVELLNTVSMLKRI
ncbi:MAG: hypothetical protein PQJ46_02390, partial [Spirochaetales bacterium]|nr:hypothetical protein [Spirochaetales bacterium]